MTIELKRWIGKAPYAAGSFLRPSGGGGSPKRLGHMNAILKKFRHFAPEATPITPARDPWGGGLLS